MKKIILKTSFSLSEKTRITDKSLQNTDKSNTVYKIGTGINLMGWKCIPELKKAELDLEELEMLLLKYCRVIAGNITLQDDKKNTFYLKGNEFVPYKEDSMMYLYGKVREVSFLTKTNVYIRCDYMNYKGEIRTGCFVASIRNYEKVMRNAGTDTGNMHLFGLVKRKLVSVPAKTEYSRITHQTRVVREAATKYQNRLVQFSIFQVNEAGLAICNEP